MEEVNSPKLSFPQRHWLLLCIVVAILSPLLVHWIQSGAKRSHYQDATEQKPVNGASGGSDTAIKDTSYKMSAPPQQTPAQPKK